MPRPTDWNAIGLSGDPTPGEPEQITQLAGTFSELGGTARRIWDAIQQVMSTTNGAFVGEAADALRSKVDQRLAGHVEDVAWAFETSAQALNEWAATVTEQQQKADAALAAGRGLAEDDPQREQLASTAREAGETQAAQGRSVAGRIESVSHIQLPISACEVFWEAFQWLAIILIIPALVLGGPIALLALGVNLTLFIKTVVDVVRGDASFLDLFLAGLGLIAPTTKGLPIFKIIKSVASAVGKGLKGLGTAALQVMRNLFTGGTLSFAHLLPNLRDVLVLTTSWVRQGGLWVMAGIRDLPQHRRGCLPARGSRGGRGPQGHPGPSAHRAARHRQGSVVRLEGRRNRCRNGLQLRPGGTRQRQMAAPSAPGGCRRDRPVRTGQGTAYRIRRTRGIRQVPLRRATGRGRGPHDQRRAHQADRGQWSGAHVPH